MSNKVWDESTYPFPNFNGCTSSIIGFHNKALSSYPMGALSALIDILHRESTGKMTKNMMILLIKTFE